MKEEDGHTGKTIMQRGEMTGKEIGKNIGKQVDNPKKLIWQNCNINN